MNKWSEIVNIVSKRPYSDMELQMILKKLCVLLGKHTPVLHERVKIKSSIYDALRLLTKKEDTYGELLYLNSLKCILHDKHFTCENLNKLLKEVGLPYKYVLSDDALDTGMFVRSNNVLHSDDIPQYDKIFISHSSLDIEIVRPFVELLEDINVDNDKIFCSSLAEYGIPLGENIADAIKKEFQNKRILVIFMLSDNYYKSAMCLNEMGAAWVMKKDYYSILLPDYEFKSIKGAIDASKIAIKLDGDKTELQNRLIELRNLIQHGLNLKKIDERIWNRKLLDFMKKIK